MKHFYSLITYLVLSNFWNASLKAQCLPLSFGAPVQSVALGGATTIVNVNPGNLIKFTGVRSGSYYSVELEKLTGIWKPELSIFDGMENYFQYSQENSYFLNLNPNSDQPFIIYKEPKYSSTPDEFYAYISSNTGGGCDSVGGSATLKVKDLGAGQIPVFDHCLDVSGSTSSSQRVSGIDVSDLKIGETKACGNTDGFSPAPAFTNSAFSVHSNSGMLNPVVIAFDPPANGNYVFKWTTKEGGVETSPDACQVEFNLFSDERLVSCDQWFGELPDFSSWVDQPVQQDRLNSCRQSGFTVGSTLGSETTIIGPCSHQGAGGISRIAQQAIPCCPDSYELSIDKVYYVVFNGKPCCPFCIELEAQYCGDSGVFTENLDDSISEESRDVLLSLPNFFNPDCSN